jgi:hypothetical protein
MARVYLYAVRRKMERDIKSDRPYENMNITGVKGLTDAEISTLKA